MLSLPSNATHSFAGNATGSATTAGICSLSGVVGTLISIEASKVRPAFVICQPSASRNTSAWLKISRPGARAAKRFIRSVQSAPLAACRTERETTPHDLARLRKQATAEIDRLLAFLDVLDPYDSTELEDDISSDLEDGNDDELALTGICRPLGGL
jgi:hypothetical protein